MEVLMERNPRDNSRERINENYLRQMLRDDARYSAQREGRTSRNADYSQSVPACEMDGNGYMSVTNGQPLAMVYAPKQEFRNLYDTKTALRSGTLFKELYFPFMGYKM